MLPCLPALLLLAAANVPPVDEILQKIAESQEAGQAAREKIVYTQFVHAKLLRMNGKVAREEKRTYTVTPSAKGSARKLEKFEGWYEKGGKRIAYSEPGFEYKDVDLDGDLINDFIEDFTGDSETRDGMDKGLFPLTASRQQKFNFRAAGPYRVAFTPKAHDSPWKGDILVDPETLYPRSMNSTLAIKIPTAVKLVFGINFRQLGLSVSYDKAIDDLWFPVSAGTEFHLRLFFKYARTLTLSLKNSDFRRASAESTVTFEPIQGETK